MTPAVRGVRVLFAGALALLGVACNVADSYQPPLKTTGSGILIIGNSLTYWNDLSGILGALADSTGDSLDVSLYAEPNYALIDHWTKGEVRTEIARGGWKVVVLQQGPSSLDANRDSLRLLTGWFNAEIIAIDAKTALFSTWPTIDRQQDFERAIESYTLAADDVDGILMPVASAWLATWARDPDIPLYSGDGLHPSITGSYLAALVMYATIFERTPVGLPRTLTSRAGIGISVSESRAAILQAAAAEVTGF